MVRYEVIVDSKPSNTIAFIKMLRARGYGLAEAKEVVDYIAHEAPDNSPLISGVERDVAVHVASQLEEAGGSARVAECTTSVPMILRPSANMKYVWSWLGVKRIEE